MSANLLIREGRALSPNDIDSKTLIHNLALNESCCAFDKGCYVGQEIINRIDVKGGNNKLLHRFRIEGEANIGEDILFNDKVVGRLSSMAMDEKGPIGMGVIRKAAWGQQRFYTASGSILNNQDL